MNAWKLQFVVILMGMLCCPKNIEDGNILNPLIEELEMLTGPHAYICKLVFLNDDIEKAWGCVTEVEKTNNPYWIAIELQGIDSSIWIAGLRTPSGNTYILEYDSNYRGGSGILPSFSRKQCVENLTLNIVAPIIIQCSRPVFNNQR